MASTLRHGVSPVTRSTAPPTIRPASLERFETDQQREAGGPVTPVASPTTG